MTKKNIKNKIPIYKLKTTDEIMNYYNMWGDGNKYDKDMEDWNYTGPKETSSIFNKYALNKNIKIYDAGCGTGLVGVELKKYGFFNICGADLSLKLLNLVPKKTYKTLTKTDLNKPINEKDNSYDAVICVGTFTFGHVKAHALNEFVRITKNKGLICFTINEGIYKEYKFDEKIKELTNNNSWIIKEFFKSSYIASKNVNAWLGIAEVTK